jgi:hypothetical protein
MASCSVVSDLGLGEMACISRLFLDLQEKFMTMFKKVSKTFQWGQHTVTMETGEDCTPVNWCCVAGHGRHRGAGHSGGQA